jgi:tripartite-type tricarboxylate transporter receptor subunit TctC
VEAIAQARRDLGPAGGGGQPPGANGISAWTRLPGQPDGYTLGTGFTSVLTSTRVYKSLPYDTFRDFVPVTQVVINTIALVMTSTCVKSAKDLVALGKSRPTSHHASAGIGSMTHLAAERCASRPG